MQTEICPIAPVQEYPELIAKQSPEHPTKIAPSSQISSEIQIPSPQIPEQIEGELDVPPVQDHPNTFPEQLELH